MHTIPLPSENSKEKTLSGIFQNLFMVESMHGPFPATQPSPGGYRKGSREAKSKKNVKNMREKPKRRRSEPLPQFMQNTCALFLPCRQKKRAYPAISFCFACTASSSRAPLRSGVICRAEASASR